MTDLQQFLDYESARQDEHARRYGLFAQFKLDAHWSGKSAIKNHTDLPAPTVAKRGIFDVIDVAERCHPIRGFTSTENLVAYVVYNHGTGANDLLLFTR